MTDIYYFGSEKVAPLSVLVDFRDGILKKVIFETDAPDEKDNDQNKKNNQAKDDLKKPALTVVEDGSKKISQSTNASPMKNAKGETVTSLPQPEYTFTSVKCGTRYAIFQEESGKLYSCGYGNAGELALGKDKTYAKTPTLIEDLYYKKIATYACGPTHVLAVTHDFKIYSWGDGSFGKQANPVQTPVYKPQVISINKQDSSKDPSAHVSNKHSLTDEYFAKKLQPDFRWKEVSCGGDFSFFAAEQGMYALGRETNGRLGVGAIFHPTWTPIPMPFFEKIRVVGVASGKSHSVAWDFEGYAYSWGDGSDGKLGHSIDKGFHMSKFEITPKRIADLEKHRILSVTCGTSHSCALTSRGEIYTWGKPTSNNTKGEKLNYKLLEYFSPKRLTVYPIVENKIDEREPVFIKVVCGPTHSAAINQDLKLYTWGDASEKCLGYPANDDVFEPKVVDRLNIVKVIDVGCGENFTFVITCPKDKHVPSKALQSFQECYLGNMRNTIKNIQEWRRRQIRDEHRTISYPNSKMGSPHSAPYDNSLTWQADVGYNNNKNILALISGGALKGYNSSRSRDSEKNSTLSKFEMNETATTKIPFTVEASKKISDIIEASTPSKKKSTLPQLGSSHKKSGKMFTTPSKKGFSSPSKHGFSSPPSYSKTLPSKAKLEITVSNYDNDKRPESIIPTANETAKSGFLPIVFSPVLQTISQHLTDFPDYGTLFGKKEHIEEMELSTEVDESTIKKLMLEQSEKRVQARNTKVAKALYEEIDTNDDQLKFEYIQMVRSGKEDEHMTYLLQDPEGEIIDAESVMKHERAKRKHQSEITSSNLRSQAMIERVQKTKQLLIEKSIPLSHELMGTISTDYLRTEAFINERGDARKLVPDETNQQPVVIVTTEDLIKRAQKRNELTRKAIHKKKQLAEEKKKHLFDKFNKHTDEYKEALRVQKIDIQKKTETMKNLSAHFMFENMLQLIRVTADRGLELKRELFLFSMKARLIQNTFKKHTILRKLKKLDPAFKKKLVHMIRTWRNNRKVRKIMLAFLRSKIKFKVKTGLFLLRIKIANVKNFLAWTHQKMEAYRYRIALDWDYQIQNTFKLKGDDVPLPSLIKYKSADSVPSGDASPAFQLNQIEDFSRKPQRNFRKFTSLQNEGSLKLPLTLIPSIIPTTYELNVNIDFDVYSEIRTKLLKKHKHDYRREITEKIRSFNNLLLPFSFHYTKALPINYRINHDLNSPFSMVLFERAMEFEANLKFDTIDMLLKEALQKYTKDLDTYQDKLIAFKKECKADINLFRTKKMLSTPVDRLKALQKKEEYQIKKRAHEMMTGKRNYRGAKARELEDYVKDHLPFGTMLLKIAASMPNAPKKPELNISIKPNDFNKHFARYYEIFKKRYSELAVEERDKLFKIKKN